MKTDTPFHLAVFGAGAMSGALAPHWVREGRTLSVAGRTRAKAERLAAAVGGSVLPWRDAATAADVVLMGVHWAGVDEVLTLAGADEGTLAGKVVIDCGNPVEIDGFTLVHPEHSLAEHMQRRTGARVVKAFNLCQHEVWRRIPDYGDQGLVVPISGDDHEAKTFVADLVAEVGATARDIGDASQAVHLEAAAAVIIRLLFSGAEVSTTFNLTSARSGY